ncbi:MAG: DMT family transporter [Paracoccaceae bacterium]|nr:DMT family transporter [Paracoccaceae bacterium]
MNATLFISTVLIWGTTWFAMALQVGPVPVLLSVFYRFATAGLLFLLGLALIGRLKVPARHHQPWLAAQALCLFGLNYLCFYSAAASVPSGLLAVVFSLATVFNALNAKVFFGEPVTKRALLASIIGVAGLVLLFGSEFETDNPTATLKGIGLAVLGTMFFSLGNMVSRRNTEAGLETIDANAWAMGYGAVFLLVCVLVTDTGMVMPSDVVFLAALLYLATFGTIVAFTTYLLLVTRIGALQAAYATVLFPIVALSISTFAEGYEWTLIKVVGVVLALAGNAVMFWKGGTIKGLVASDRTQI